MKQPYLVDVMQKGDIIESRWLVQATSEQEACNLFREFMLRNQIYQGLTLAVEPLEFLQPHIAKVW